MGCVLLSEAGVLENDRAHSQLHIKISDGGIGWWREERVDVVRVTLRVFNVVTTTEIV